MAFSTVASTRSAAGLGRVLPSKCQRARVVVRAESDDSIPEQKDTVFYGGNSYTAAEVRLSHTSEHLYYCAPAVPLPWCNGAFALAQSLLIRHVLRDTWQCSTVPGTEHPSSCFLELSYKKLFITPLACSSRQPKRLVITSRHPQATVMALWTRQ